MKFLTLILIFCASTSFAAPFLVCDRDTSANPPTEYQITLPSGQTWMVANAPAITTGLYGFKADIANAPVGTTSISVKACKVDPIWGTLCSVASTYPLARTAPPLSPALLIVAQ
jgi:hypothetical protein